MPLPDWLMQVREAVTNKALAYRRTFNLDSLDAQAVLEDLARFCRAHASTAHADPHMAARLDGRREVWLHIQRQLRLDDKTIWSLHPRNPQRGE